MAIFHIQPHGRLQEWVADEKGYFRDEGLTYIFASGFDMGKEKRKSESEVKYGAFESYKQNDGNKGAERSDISCACHWAVNQAAAENAGNIYRGAYVVTPGAIMTPPESRVRKPEDLAGVEIGVGYHSGSHFTTIQALEPFLGSDQIKLKFIGAPMARLDAILDGDIEAVSVWGLSYQILEQLGFRRVADTTFMIAFMFPRAADPEDVEKYMRGIKRAQMEIDLHPERYKHHYLSEIPERFKDKVDVRLFGTGERVVFLSYTDQAYEQTQNWMKEHNLFAEAV
ncbi:MAG: ABC transporter substrate-binding protein [Candidatus Binataceae bacterium]